MTEAETPTRLAALARRPARAAGAEVALVVVAHGAAAEWNAGVRRAAAGVRWRLGPARVAFLVGSEVEDSGWDVVVERLAEAGAREVIVVPLLVSSSSPRYRHVLACARRLPISIRVTPALDDAPELSAALLTRWRALDGRDRRRPVLLVAHGPNDAPDAAQWLANLTRVAAMLDRGAALRYPVRVGLMRDEAPEPTRTAAIGELRDTVLTLAARTGDAVLVMPVLISTGVVDRTKLPRDLAELPIRYVPSPLARLPVIARWIERSAQLALRCGA